MTVNSSRAGKLARLSREALAIFVGVTAALAGQAWFEEHADRTAEREVLSAVLAEVESNEESAGRRLEQLQVRGTELRAFHEFLGAEATAFLGDSVLNGAAQLMRTGGPNIVSAAIDDALQSGNLRLIRDPDVRSMLSRYQDRIRIQRERSDDHQDWTNKRVRSFLIENARIDDYNGMSESLGTSFPASHFAGGGEQLVRSREFENLVRDQILWHAEIEGNLASFLEGVAYVNQQLRSALEPR